VTFLAIVLSLALAGSAAGQQEPAGRGRGRGTPPQPQQKQGVEYFAGRWSFAWTGRESPITAGPRKGTTVFTSSGNGLEIRTEGTVEDGNAAFQESGSAEWDGVKKALTLKEILANGTTLTGTGDWSSPVAIRYESQPAQIGTQSVRIRRTYSILSAQSFSIAEEISIDGGPFQRLGNGLFQKE
jgi:hypothetical protein